MENKHYAFDFKYIVFTGLFKIFSMECLSYSNYLPHTNGDDDGDFNNIKYGNFICDFYLFISIGPYYFKCSLL